VLFVFPSPYLNAIGIENLGWYQSPPRRKKRCYFYFSKTIPAPLIKVECGLVNWGQDQVD
jgi:hypothetical protein